MPEVDEYSLVPAALLAGPAAAGAARVGAAGVALPAGLREIQVRLAESPPIELTGLPESALQVSRVLGSPHPEVGEVVEKEAESLLAVLCVLPGIQDVLMPHRVHFFARDDGLRMRNGEDEEVLVLQLHLTALLRRPALALFGVHQLELDGVKIKGEDRLLDAVKVLGYMNFHLNALLK